MSYTSYDIQVNVKRHVVWAGQGDAKVVEHPVVYIMRVSHSMQIRIS